MIANGAGQKDRLTRAGLFSGDVDPIRNNTKPGRGDKDAIALALFHHLGVAGDNGHACLIRRPRHRHDDALQIGEWKAFLKNKPGGQIERPRPGHGDVVHRAMNRQRADVTARKEQRRDHVAIGRKHQPSGRHTE